MTNEQPIGPTEPGPERRDPYRDFRFRVLFADSTGTLRVVAGVTQVSSLGRSTSVVEPGIGGDPAAVTRAPGPKGFEPVMLSRGVTHDEEFQKWISLVGTYLADPAENFGQSVWIQVRDETGRPVLQYHLHHCWPSEYQALSALDVSGNGVAFELVKLEHEGWEREHVAPGAPGSI